jgi:hypothetical protein
MRTRRSRWGEGGLGRRAELRLWGRDRSQVLAGAVGEGKGSVISLLATGVAYHGGRDRGRSEGVVGDRRVTRS